MTELTNYQPTAPVHVGLTPDVSLTEWVNNLGAAHKIATALCSTSFVPQHFRGKPDEAAAAILFGHEVGFSPTTSLQTLYVISGKPAMYARPMVALVQAAGHDVWTESKSDESVTVCGQRRGSEHVIRETWDIQRAKKAGYTNNKKYQSDPQAMLYARAASDVCRQVAADVLTGIGYSVEEMQLTGRDVDAPLSAPSARPAGLAAVRAAVAPSPQQEPEDAEIVTDEPAQPEAKTDLTDKTRGRLFALFAERGIDDADEQRRGISHIIGRPIASRSELTEADAQAVIDQLTTMAGAK